MVSSEAKTGVLVIPGPSRRASRRSDLVDARSRQSCDFLGEDVLNLRSHSEWVGSEVAIHSVPPIRWQVRLSTARIVWISRVRTSTGAEAHGVPNRCHRPAPGSVRRGSPSPGPLRRSLEGPRSHTDHSEIVPIERTCSQSGMAHQRSIDLRPDTADRTRENNVPGSRRRIARQSARRASSHVVISSRFGVMSMWNSMASARDNLISVDRDGSWSPASRRATCGWRMPTRRPNSV